MKQQNQIKKLVKFINLKSRKKRKIFFFFDYDGVLVPIQKNPATAYLPQFTKKSLVNLSKSKHAEVGIVSGRALNTLKKLTKIKDKNITFAGSHGLEMLYKGKCTLLSKNNLKALKKIKPKITKLAKSRVAGFFEKKPYSLTFHIRDKRKINFVNLLGKSFNKLIKKEGLAKNLKVLEGKNIVEVLPQDVNKGKAVEKIIKIHPKYLYFYFGDDITDIDAFKAVKKHYGFSVSLNPKLKYKSDFLITSQKLVPRFLKTFNS